MFPLRIYTALKLCACVLFHEFVCFPYEFTLLSNILTNFMKNIGVCFPYEFTLLSNDMSEQYFCIVVCFPYEFTLLSNPDHDLHKLIIVCFPYEFTLLSNSTFCPMKPFSFVSPTNLHCSQTKTVKESQSIGLFPLRIYTALKQSCSRDIFSESLFPLRIYTALKLKCK